MAECRRLDSPCLLVAGSGLLALLALAYGSVYPFVPAAVSVLSLAIALHYVLDPPSRLAATALAGASWLAAIGGYETGSMPLLAASLASGYALVGLSLLRGGLAAGLAGFAAMYAPLLTLGAYSMEAATVFSVGYVLVAGLLAGAASGRMHVPLVTSILAVPLLLLPPEAIATVSLLAYTGIVAASGGLRWSRCPFSVDSGLVFTGMIVGLAGAGLLGVEGAGLREQGLGLYVLGLLLLLAGVLTPVSRAPARPS